MRCRSERIGLAPKCCFHSCGVSSVTREAECSDALQDIDEVRIGIDCVQSTSDDQALHDPDGFGAQLGPTEIPIFSAHRNRAQRALQMIRVDRDVRVAQEHFPAESSLPHIAEGLSKRIARQQPLPLELSGDPLEERSTIGVLCAQHCACVKPACCA